MGADPVVDARVMALTASMLDLREDTKACRGITSRLKVLTVSYLGIIASTWITKYTGALAADTCTTSIPLDLNRLGQVPLKVSGCFDSSDSFTLDKIHPTYRQRCLEGYFHFFHQAHPFLAPREHALELFRTQPIPHLETAMCYVASHYISTSLTAAFAVELETLLASADIPKDGYLVQALLLFVIGLDGNNEQLRALEVLTRVQRVAIELGMHQHDFAILNGGGLPVLEESWRRTWWELYIVNGFIAGLHQISTFQLFEIVANVPLPCDEDVLRSGVSHLYYLGLEAKLIFFIGYLHAIHN